MAWAPREWSLLAEDVLLKLLVLNAAWIVSVDDLEEGVDKLSLDWYLQLGDQVSDLVNGKVSTLVQVKVIEDLLKELRVLAGELPDARLNFTKQVGDGLLSDLGVFLLGNLPSWLHHAHEILIRGRAHRKIRVVVVPLLSCDDAIVVSSRAIKVVKEVLENLIAGLAALEELWVHANIIDAGNVADGKLARAVSVHHLEGLVHHGHATGCQLIPI